MDARKCDLTPELVQSRCTKRVVVASYRIHSGCQGQDLNPTICVQKHVTDDQSHLEQREGLLPVRVAQNPWRKRSVALAATRVLEIQFFNVNEKSLLEQ
jgi:hypothetical protein